MDHPWHKINFNNEVESREALVPLSGEQVLEHFATFDQLRFGKEAGKKRRRDEDNRWHNWRKKSIFF